MSGDQVAASMHEEALQHHALSKRLDQEDAHSLHVLSTAKLVTTFAAAIAAGLLATAFQDDGPWIWDVIAAVGLLLTFGVTIKIVTVQRPTRTCISALSKKSANELRESRQEATKELRKLADDVHRLMNIQLELALVTSAVAITQVIVAVYLKQR